MGKTGKWWRIGDALLAVLRGGRSRRLADIGSCRKGETTIDGDKINRDWLLIMLMVTMTTTEHKMHGISAPAAYKS